MYVTKQTLRGDLTSEIVDTCIILNKSIAQLTVEELNNCVEEVYSLYFTQKIGDSNKNYIRVYNCVVDALFNAGKVFKGALK